MIFIVGNSRSGTTMLGRALGKHSDIYTFEELHFFEQMVDSDTVLNKVEWTEKRGISLLERLLTSARANIFATPIRGAFAQDVATILASTAARDPTSLYVAFLDYEARRLGKVVPCEQTPRYLFFVEEILSAFPNARVVNVTRDPRDIMLSQKNKWKTYFLGTWNMPVREAIRAWMNYHPILIARLWVAAIRQSKRFAEHPRFTSIRFEDLVQQPSETLKSLCRFLEIDYEAGMLQVEQIGSSTRKDDARKIGVDSGRAGSWRRGGLTSFEVAVCEHVAGREMTDLGYQSSGAKLSLIRYYGSMLALAFKGTVSLLMNWSRTRNLAQTLRRRLGV